MAKIPLNLPHHRYQIIIDPGSLRRLGDLVRQVAPHGHAAMIVDDAVAHTYGQTGGDALRAAGYDVTLATMPADETHKSLATWQGLLERLLDARLERASPIIAMGGGITGDTAGFVAAAYLRGVPLIQCPTTLLAMVDASVGGKVGVNMPQGKNLVGAFYQPRLVIIDTDTLATLPERELRCGLAECIKHGVIRDQDLFDWTTRNAERLLGLDRDALVELVRRNVSIKAAVVMEDEKEAGVRAHLNFGHTFAHAIEAATGYTAYKHGEAVALGMLAATHLACDSGRCEASALDRLEEAIMAVNLPTVAHDLPSNEALMAAMRADKKIVDGHIRVILPTRIGTVSVFDDVSDSDILAAWATIRG